MGIDMLACIVSVCSDSTIESHEDATEYDTHSEYLDSGFHDDEYSSIVHKKTVIIVMIAGFDFLCNFLV